MSTLTFDTYLVREAPNGDEVEIDVTVRAWSQGAYLLVEQIQVRPGLNIAVNIADLDGFEELAWEELAKQRDEHRDWKDGSDR